MVGVLCLSKYSIQVTFSSLVSVQNFSNLRYALPDSSMSTWQEKYCHILKDWVTKYVMERWPG